MKALLEALTSALLADEALTALVDDRVVPNKAIQEDIFWPYIVFSTSKDPNRCRVNDGSYSGEVIFEVYSDEFLKLAEVIEALDAVISYKTIATDEYRFSFEDIEENFDKIENNLREGFKELKVSYLANKK